MDGELVKWFATLGVGGVLAWCMFLIYRKDAKEWREEYAQLSSGWKGQCELLVGLVRDNTAAITQNTAVVQSLHQHISDGERRHAAPTDGRPQR